MILSRIKIKKYSKIFILLFFTFELFPQSTQPIKPSEDFIIHFGILESHGTNILMIDPETGTILRANKAAKEFYGYPNLEGMKIQEINILSPDKIKEEMQNAARQNRNFFNFKHKTASGQIKSVEVYSYPIQFQGKSVLLSIIHDVTKEKLRKQIVFNISMAGFSVFLILVIFYLIRSIVERKKAEENLKAIQNSLENAQEIANMGSWELNVLYHNCIWSKNLYNLLGYRFGSVTPSQSLFLQSLYPEDIKVYKKAEDNIIRTRKPGSVEVRYYSGNHEIHWCRIHIYPIFENDELTFLKAAFIDITEAKEFEIKFKSQLGYLEVAIEISRDFMNISTDDFETLIHRSLESIKKKFQADLVSIIKYSNPEDDYTIKDYVSESNLPYLEDIFLGENLENIPEAKKKAILGEIFLIQNTDLMPEKLDKERRYLHKRGTTAILGIPIYHHGKLIGYLSLESFSKKDIFDNDKILSLLLICEIYASVFLRRKIFMNLVRKTEEASLANKAKSVFLSNISHEIRTPLNGVLGFAELLMNTELNPIQKEYLTSINISARALLEIISNLIDLSKLESGKFELEEVATDLKQLVMESLEIVKYSLLTKGLKYKIELPNEISHLVKVDYQRIRQVLVNLLSNAIKFTHKGEIILRLEFNRLDDNKGKFKFTVKDTGIGMSHSMLFQIKKSFQQDKGELAKRYSGSGIGLAICNSILKYYNSSLEVQSEEGVGSEFSFTLVLDFYKPDKDNHQPTKNENAISDLQLEKNKPKVLIVEDNDLNLKLVKNLIKNINSEIHILEARDGVEALDIYKQYSPDLIIMDVNLPKMNGLEATEAIREWESKIPYQKKVAIVGLTAGVTKEDIEKDLQSGMNEVLTKPIQKEELKQVIDNYLMTLKSEESKVSLNEVESTE